MTSKSLLIIGTLALAGIASAKSYDIVLSAPEKAGSVQLAAGQYSLQVKGTNATFTNLDTGKSFTTAVKTQDTGKKFEQTRVDTNADSITTIGLGGSTTQLDLE